MLDAATQQAASNIVETPAAAAAYENCRKRPTTTTPDSPNEPPTSTDFSSASVFTINLSDVCTVKPLNKGLTFDLT